MNLARTLSTLAVLAVMLAIPSSAAQAGAAQDAPMYSIWVLESSRFLDVPAGGFMPDRAYVPAATIRATTTSSSICRLTTASSRAATTSCSTTRLETAPVHLEMQKAPWGGGSDHFAPAAEQLAQVGITPDQVTKVVVGHGHWDHAGQVGDFPNATLYIQGEELRGIDWALKYPNPKISAVNTSPGGCARTPACGYPPQTLQEIYGKVLGGKAVIVEGEMDIAPGVRSFRPSAPTPLARSCCEVHTAKGELVFGSDAYSSWEGHPRLDGGQHPADRHRPAVPGLREVLPDHAAASRTASPRTSRSRTPTPIRPGEFLGRAERLARRRGRPRARRAVS